MHTIMVSFIVHSFIQLLRKYTLSGLGYQYQWHSYYNIIAVTSGTIIDLAVLVPTWSCTCSYVL